MEIRKRRTTIFSDTYMYQKYPYQFTELEKNVFNTFESIVKEGWGFFNFVVYVSKKDRLVELHFCNIENVDFGIGGMEFRFDTFFKSDATSVIANEIHRAVCSELIKQIKSNGEVLTY